MSIKFNSDGSIKLPTSKSEKIVVSEKMEKGRGIAVIDEKKMNTYPKTKIDCPKCKGKEAFFWTMQTRSADESETKFYKCTKCDHTWREYR